MNTSTKSSIHIPVLLQEVIHYLDAQPGDVVFDGTLGGGGYTREILRYSKDGIWVVATDQDKDAVERFGTHPQVEIHHARFSQLEEVVGERKLDAAVLDLGISSDQLNDRHRGISFAEGDAPLDMRMNQSTEHELTARDILHSYSEEEIADILYLYGEERRSRPIARSIKQCVAAGEMETVDDLVNAVTKVVPRRGKINPATRTFQALRIAVNDELGELERFLVVIPNVMREKSRLVIVSFHSLEDRIVKHTYRRWKEEGRGEIITKKPVIPTDEEVKENPRSRSSKLRAFEFT